jgi:hypothetical protein
MKRIIVISMVVTVLATGLTIATPASADRAVFNNWHVHNGLPGGRPAAFFPAILGVSLADYQANPALWAYCPNATDKALLGDGVVEGSKSTAGVCMNEKTVIHLLSVPADQSPPEGWTRIPGSSTGYYMLSSRG